MTIQEAIKEAHECAVAHKFYDTPRSVPALLALINTELSEAIEADRENKYIKNIYQFKGILWEMPEMKAGSDDIEFKKLYETYLKDTFESELADACIRIFDLAGYLGIELWNPPTHLNEPDVSGNIMEVMSQIGYLYQVYRQTIIWENYNYEDYRPLLSGTLGIIFAITKKLEFNLWAHVEATMRYNRLREVKHGKKY
jgi:NTP pyrophosphatase (non-canonical NTP hydrolase)